MQKSLEAVFIWNDGKREGYQTKAMYLVIVNASRIPPRPLSGSEGRRKARRVLVNSLGGFLGGSVASWETFWHIQISHHDDEK